MQNQKELEKLLNTDSEESQPKPVNTSIWARYPDPIKSGARYPDPPKSEERFQEAMQVKTSKKRQPKKQKISELGDSVAPDKSLLFSDDGSLELLASVALTVPRADTKEAEIHPADEMALAEWKKHSSYDRWVVEGDFIKADTEHCTTLYEHYEEVRRKIYENLRITTPHKDVAHASP
jgi:hypothetical protein